MKGTIVYASKYGSTEKVCRWIHEGIRNHTAEIRRVTQPITEQKEFIVLGTPIFIGKPAEEFLEFIDLYRHELCRVPTFLFITSWAQSTRYSDACRGFLDFILSRMKPCSPVLTRSLSGKLIVNELKARDRNIMQRLLRRIDAQQPDFHSESIQWSDRRSRLQCNRFGEEIDQCLSSGAFTGITKSKISSTAFENESDY